MTIYKRLRALLKDQGDNQPQRKSLKILTPSVAQQTAQPNHQTWKSTINT